ncbi:BA75_02173T0 [Komagataella pastoris]|uniref:BA75_02173T0 n=1 Tax=Komagataella pastoris TaxID=4922 RepID=A0A1B2JC53_PICPA|nr:BA75_02173T0 [Komagataella pastoris]
MVNEQKLASLQTSIRLLVEQYKDTEPPYAALLLNLCEAVSELSNEVAELKNQLHLQNQTVEQTSLDVEASQRPQYSSEHAVPDTNLFKLHEITKSFKDSQQAKMIAPQKNLASVPDTTHAPTEFYVLKDDGIYQCKSCDRSYDHLTAMYNHYKSFHVKHKRSFDDEKATEGSVSSGGLKSDMANSEQRKRENVSIDHVENNYDHDDDSDDDDIDGEENEEEAGKDVDDDEEYVYTPSKNSISSSRGINKPKVPSTKGKKRALLYTRLGTRYRCDACYHDELDVIFNNYPMLYNHIKAKHFEQLTNQANYKGKRVRKEPAKKKPSSRRKLKYSKVDDEFRCDACQEQHGKLVLIKHYPILYQHIKINHPEQFEGLKTKSDGSSMYSLHEIEDGLGLEEIQKLVAAGELLKNKSRRGRPSGILNNYYLRLPNNQFYCKECQGRFGSYQSVYLHLKTQHEISNDTVPATNATAALPTQTPVETSAATGVNSNPEPEKFSSPRKEVGVIETILAHSDDLEHSIASEIQSQFSQ